MIGIGISPLGAVIGSLGGAAPWSPAGDANLFFAIAPGTAFTTLYTERTGASATTVAVATDPVGTIKCNITNRYIVFNDDAKRPILTADGDQFYLAADGSNDAGATSATIDLSEQTAVDVFVGARKTSASTRILYEFSPTTSSNNGSFHAAQNSGASGVMTLSSRPDNVTVNISSAYYTVPNDENTIETHRFDVTQNTLETRHGHRLSGVPSTPTQVANNSSTGVFGDYSLYLFGRNESSLYFAGRLYCAFFRFGVADSETVANYEALVDSLTPGVSL